MPGADVGSGANAGCVESGADGGVYAGTAAYAGSCAADGLGSGVLVTIADGDDRIVEEINGYGIA
jgi:hypothetical protein